MFINCINNDEKEGFKVMKLEKKKVLVGAMLIGIMLMGGCQSRSAGINSIDGEIIEKLPEDQRDVELDKALASLRKSRKEGYSSLNGLDISIAPNGSLLPGQSENIPDFSDLNESFYQMIYDYLENELKIPKRTGYVYDVASSLDPRMNAIYDDEDKGVAAGYENENIYVVEYETEIDDVYSHLILVRDTKDSPWKVIHQGNSYKE